MARRDDSNSRPRIEHMSGLHGPPRFHNTRPEIELIVSLSPEEALSRFLATATWRPGALFSQVTTTADGWTAQYSPMPMSHEALRAECLITAVAHEGQTRVSVYPARLQKGSRAAAITLSLMCLLIFMLVELDALRRRAGGFGVLALLILGSVLVVIWLVAAGARMSARTDTIVFVRDALRREER